jgi:hypothetical protein
MTEQRCIICKEKTHAFYHPKTQVLFHECPSCEVIYKDQLHYPTRLQEKKTYDDHHNSTENIGYVNFLNNFIDSAVLPFKKQGRVLDFGSGPVPVLASLMRESGDFEVDIYDPHYANDFIFEKHYDIITATEVIEHLKDPIETFKLLKTYLKDDGIISIMTLFHGKNREQFLDWFYIRDVTHLVFYTPKTMEVMAKSIGMNVIDTNAYRYTVMKNVLDTLNHPDIKTEERP